MFRHAVTGSPAEVLNIQKFLELVETTDGIQSRLDKHVARAYPTWSGMRALSHRAAMVGRLIDLKAIRVDGKGPRSRIVPLAPATDLVKIRNGQVQGRA